MDIERYLDRISYGGPREPSPQALAEIQRRHLMTVPFESLDPHLGIEVSVEPSAAYRKVVDDRRGGFCFELNGLLAWALEELGYGVTRLAARPIQGDGNLAPEFAHMTLMVELERRWLVDVGFGSPFILEPIDIDERGPQTRGGYSYAVREDDGALVAEELETTEPNAYRFDLEEQPTTAFAERCRAYSTEPDSSFVRRGVVAQTFADGWANLTVNRIRGEHGGERYERTTESREQWLAQLERTFGLTIDGTRVTGRPAP